MTPASDLLTRYFTDYDRRRTSEMSLLDYLEE